MKAMYLEKKAKTTYSLE